MKQKLLQLTFLWLFTGGLTALNAQETVVVSGGDATGSGGVASYSIGQMVYSATTGSNGSVAQGVQQAFEISTTLGIGDNFINLSFIASPNPTTDVLTLKIGNFNQNNMKYAPFDIQGRLLIQQKIQQENTDISTENLAPAIYFLKIINQNIIIKIFKILKN